MVAVAFFLLMQRSFRHDLILLLILSDTLKTLWLVIPQAMELAHGNVSSTSTICQISGFFLSVGIEACDLAVLLMAAHTALYILRGRSGLYPYRYLAYILVAAVSLMLASLAFINQPAFFNSGPYCYLPHQPGWTSRALSWIPRYVIIAAIMLTYTFIYVYVTCVLKNFEKGDGMNGANGARPTHEHSASDQTWVPPTPPIVYHGLLPPTPSSDGVFKAYAWKKNPQLSEAVLTQSKGNAQSTLKPRQENEGAKQLHMPKPQVVERTSFPANQEPGQSAGGDQVTGCLRSNKHLHKHLHINSRPEPYAPSKTFGRCLTCLGEVSPSRQTGLAPKGRRLRVLPGEWDSSPDLVLSPSTLNATGMPGVRQKIRRQLGHLFLYPLVYVAGWLIPFISHVMGGHESAKPFGLVLAGLTSLCIQGMADSLVFLLLEKPWRFWNKGGSGCRLFDWCKQPAIKGNKSKVGRTREEMLIAGTMARQRRQREAEEGRVDRTSSVSRGREWWDVVFAGIDDCSDGGCQRSIANTPG